MAWINRNLLEALQNKLNLSERQVYRLIQQKANESLEELPNAAILLAQEHGIDIRKYTTPEERAQLKGSLSGSRHATTVATRPVPPSPKFKRTSIIFNIDFVSNDNIRRMIARDIAELNTVLANGYERVPKTCMILAGSIAETLLLDSLFKIE